MKKLIEKKSTLIILTIIITMGFIITSIPSFIQNEKIETLRNKLDTKYDNK